MSAIDIKIESEKIVALSGSVRGTFEILKVLSKELRSRMEHPLATLCIRISKEFRLYDAPHASE